MTDVLPDLFDDVEKWLADASAPLYKSHPGVDYHFLMHDGPLFAHSIKPAIPNCVCLDRVPRLFTVFGVVQEHDVGKYLVLRRPAWEVLGLQGRRLCVMWEQQLCALTEALSWWGMDTLIEDNELVLQSTVSYQLKPSTVVLADVVLSIEERKGAQDEEDYILAVDTLRGIAQVDT
ncbi:hypothetical protein C8R44DRAFT_893575 [Mycena epipterygia]|nr:hypothetical protein C8R44DRAFT_893575 [Mycena epipterygia]